MGKSNHEIIALDVVCEVFNSISKERKPNFSQADAVGIDKSLKGKDWIMEMSGMSASESWDFMADIFKYVTYTGSLPLKK